MSIPDFEYVSQFLREHAQVPEGTPITPTTNLRRDLGMSDATIATFLQTLSGRMRLPFDTNPDDLKTWFTTGLTHERSKE